MQLAFKSRFISFAFTKNRRPSIFDDRIELAWRSGINTFLIQDTRVEIRISNFDRISKRLGWRVHVDRRLITKEGENASKEVSLRALIFSRERGGAEIFTRLEGGYYRGRREQFEMDVFEGHWRRSGSMEERWEKQQSESAITISLFPPCTRRNEKARNWAQETFSSSFSSSAPLSHGYTRTRLNEGPQ